MSVQICLSQFDSPIRIEKKEEHIVSMYHFRWVEMAATFFPVNQHLDDRVLLYHSASGAVVLACPISIHSMCGKSHRGKSQYGTEQGFDAAVRGCVCTKTFK